MLNWQCINIFWCLILSTVFVLKAEPYGINNQLTEAHIKINDKVHGIKNIPSEGGPIKINDKNESISQETTLNKPVVGNVSTESTKVATPNITLSVIHGREGIGNKSTTESSSVLASNITKYIVNTVSTTEKVIPVSEAETVTTKYNITANVTIKVNLSSTTEKTPIEFTGDSKIKPRKGAPTYLPEITSSSTQKPKKMKPTVTVGSDDEPYPPSNFVPHTNSKKDHTNSSDLKLKQADGYVGAKYFKKGPDYVLPIVLTILAVPLVAIVIAVLYKRGSEWWHHRHYRRMDFLIDGMYNN